MNYVISISALLLGGSYYMSIRKQSGRIVRLIYFELIYNLFVKYLIGSLKLPSAINYITDFVLIWIVMEYIHQKKRRVPHTLVICFSLLWISTMISYVFNMYSPLLYLWGFRNCFRAIIFAMMCAVYLKKKDVQTILDILYGFFVLNIFVVTYQFFNYRSAVVSFGDFISGLYNGGLEQRGGNTAITWLAVIVCTNCVINYLNRTGPLTKMIISVSGTMYIATLAEIKLLYFVIVIISVSSVLMCKKSVKSVFLFLFGCVVISLAVKYLYVLFPNFNNFFKIQRIISYASRENGYSASGGGVDRLTAISYVLNNFLKSIPHKLFGIGLGNADYSGFAFLTSEFYRENSGTSYMFFSSSFVLTELGICGLILYIANILNFVKNAIKMSTNDIYEKSLCELSVLIGFLAVFFVFSNVSLKAESSSYMVFCILSLPFVLRKRDDNTKLGESLIKNKFSRMRKHF